MGYYLKDNMNHNKRKQQRADALNQVKQTLAHPSVSALVYGYLKEKDVNLKGMSVEDWKKIEQDIVEIILAEIYPGEEIPEDQLSFTALAHSFAFMSNFIETLNRNLDNTADASSNKSSVESQKNEEKKTPNSEPKFEV